MIQEILCRAVDGVGVWVSIPGAIRLVKRRGRRAERKMFRELEHSSIVVIPLQFSVRYLTLVKIALHDGP